LVPDAEQQGDNNSINFELAEKLFCKEVAEPKKKANSRKRDQKSDSKTSQLL
jgi:hypothetical protein